MTSVPLERKPKFVCWFMRTTSWPLSLLPSLWYLPLRTRHAGLLSFPPGLRVCSHFRSWTQDGSFTWDLLPLISIGIISPCRSASTWSVTSSELSFRTLHLKGFLLPWASVKNLLSILLLKLFSQHLLLSENHLVYSFAYFLYSTLEQNLHKSPDHAFS